MRLDEVAGLLRLAGGRAELGGEVAGEAGDDRKGGHEQYDPGQDDAAAAAVGEVGKTGKTGCGLCRCHAGHARGARRLATTPAGRNSRVPSGVTNVPLWEDESAATLAA